MNEPLIATRHIFYRRRAFVAGERFEATPIDAGYLIRTGDAEPDPSMPRYEQVVVSAPRATAELPPVAAAVVPNNVGPVTLASLMAPEAATEVATEVTPEVVTEEPASEPIAEPQVGETPAKRTYTRRRPAAE